MKQERQESPSSQTRYDPGLRQRVRDALTQPGIRGDQYTDRPNAGPAG